MTGDMYLGSSGRTCPGVVMCVVIIAVTIPPALHKLYCIQFEYVRSYPNNNWDTQHYLCCVLRISPSLRIRIFSETYIG
jgi:hypothetical protein